MNERKRGRRRRPKEKSALAPLVQKPKLDLEQPKEVPLSERERTEIGHHLSFLLRYKGVLRLKLNAVEDRLVTGSLVPEDRGVVKHLLKKVDRSVVEQAIAREPLKSNNADRARFLAGVVRLDPSLSTLISYLEALAASSDKKDAARALHLVIERVDFGEASEAQTSRLVDLASVCFEGHELNQAVLALVSSRTFVAAMERARSRFSEASRVLLDGISAAERTIIRGEPLPDDDNARNLVARGADRLLSAPEPILRSYPEQVRQRLAEHAALQDPLGQPVRTLIDSIPHKTPRYVAVALSWSERLLVRGEDERARGVLEQIAQAHPSHEIARERLTALSWPRLGRVALMPRASEARGEQSERSRERGLRPSGTRDPDANLSIIPGFWLDGSAFVWVRRGASADRDRFEREAEMQAKLTTPGVLPVLAWGAADDGAPWIAIGRRGKPMLLERPPALPAALDLARAGLLIFKALAREGVELPDAERKRFAIAGKSELLLFDLGGARTSRPEQADVTHAPLAHRWVKSVLAGHTDLPRELAEVVSRRPPLPVLLRIIDRVRAKM